MAARRPRPPCSLMVPGVGVTGHCALRHLRYSRWYAARSSGGGRVPECVWPARYARWATRRRAAARRWWSVRGPRSPPPLRAARAGAATARQDHGHGHCLAWSYNTFLPAKVPDVRFAATVLEGNRAKFTPDEQPRTP